MSEGGSSLGVLQAQGLKVLEMVPRSVEKPRLPRQTHYVEQQLPLQYAEFRLLRSLYFAHYTFDILNAVIEKIDCLPGIKTFTTAALRQCQRTYQLGLDLEIFFVGLIFSIAMLVCEVKNLDCFLEPPFFVVSVREDLDALNRFGIELEVIREARLLRTSRELHETCEVGHEWSLPLIRGYV